MEKRDPISAKVRAPRREITPPSDQAMKKSRGVLVAEATMAGVRKIPMPMTRLTTIMVVSKVVSFALIIAWQYRRLFFSGFQAIIYIMNRRRILEVFDFRPFLIYLWCMILVLTGPVHSGKTSLLRKLIPQLKAEGVRVGGFLSPAVVKDGKTHGYDLFDLKKERTMPSLRRRGRKDWQRIGPYFFVPAALDAAREIILTHEDGEFLVVDEVGPLELQGQGLWPALSSVLRRPALRCLLVVRRPLLGDIRTLLGRKSLRVFDLEREDISWRLAREISSSSRRKEKA